MDKLSVGIIQNLAVSDLIANTVLILVPVNISTMYNVYCISKIRLINGSLMSSSSSSLPLFNPYLTACEP